MPVRRSLRKSVKCHRYNAFVDPNLVDSDRSFSSPAPLGAVAGTGRIPGSSATINSAITVGASEFTSDGLIFNV